MENFRPALLGKFPPALTPAQHTPISVIFHSDAHLEEPLGWLFWASDCGEPLLCILPTSVLLTWIDKPKPSHARVVGSFWAGRRRFEAAAERMIQAGQTVLWPDALATNRTRCCVLTVAELSASAVPYNALPRTGHQPRAG